jgi:adenylylsulfate kinase-like enzyme
MVIWLMGLSGAGKTTIGLEVVKMWKQLCANIVHIDGDEVRKVFRHTSGDAYSLEGRKLNADRIHALCALLDQQNINVVCSVLTPFQSTRDQNRRVFGRYFEVYVSAPLDVLIQRDRKNLYAPALRGELKDVVGIDVPFEVPKHPDLIIDNGLEFVDLRETATDILGRAGAIPRHMNTVGAAVATLKSLREHAGDG